MSRIPNNKLHFIYLLFTQTFLADCCGLHTCVKLKEQVQVQVQIQHTLRQRQNFNQKSSGIPIRIAGVIRIRIRMSVGSVPQSCDALSCQRQSFRQVWYKATVDCMSNANKCQKILLRNGQRNAKVIYRIHSRRIRTERDRK